MQWKNTDITELDNGDFLRIAYDNHFEDEKFSKRIYLVEKSIGDTNTSRIFEDSDTATNKATAYAYFYELQEQHA